MLRILLLGVALAATAAAQSRAPVLVELFTSEGCSSCPPADRILEQLDRQVIVLSEHVDYWDHQGWKDPFSSHAFTGRQEGYTRLFHLEGVYTPEMVVDGEAEFVGNNAHRASEAVARAATRKKAEVRLERTAAGVKVAIAASPAAGRVYMAVADPSGASDVAGGENRGRQLRYVSIVRSIQEIGSVKRNATFSREVELPRDTSAERIVVFVQEPGPGRVYGAAMLPPN